MAQVTKRDDESYAKAFTRKYENDLSLRKQWAAVTEAKQLVALSKGMASLEPTSVEAGSVARVIAVRFRHVSCCCHPKIPEGLFIPLWRVQVG
jgi:hypothetical protein